MNDYQYLIALAHLPRWRVQKINKLFMEILYWYKLTYEEFFELNNEDLERYFELNDKEIMDIKSIKRNILEYESLAKEVIKQHCEIIPVDSSDYPKILKRNLRTNYSPPIIYVKGNKDLLNKKKVAIVGSRNVSSKGISFTKKITQKLVESGNVIVSGFAKGVDRLSLEVALDNGGQSIIVLPQGILTPLSGLKKYHHHVLEGNVLIFSTFHPKLPWSVGSAMSRNRYIYGLVNHIYVSESNTKGGTWEGVIDALKKNKKFKLEKYRKIYVRYVDENERSANNLLIRRGAIGINDELEIIEDNKLRKQKFILSQEQYTKVNHIPDK